MDIVVWLRSLGLGKYEAAFRENEIDETVLPGLTAEDLKELGVAALGHRRKLLDAIAALRADASSKPPSADVATTSTAPSTSPEDRAERTTATAAFDTVRFAVVPPRPNGRATKRSLGTYRHRPVLAFLTPKRQ